MTTNADLAHFPPSLAINQGSGGPIQNSGSVDFTPISVRKVGDGTLPLDTEIAMITQIPDGLINVQGCTSLTIWMVGVVGSLTNFTLRMVCLNTIGGTEFPLPFMRVDHSSALIDVSDLVFPTFGGTDAEVFVLPMHGINWVKFYIDANGTVTNSSMILDVTRGCGSIPTPYTVV